MLQTSETTNVLLCSLGNERYALPMSAVREVLRWRTPTPIPGTRAELLGVLHHRGAIVPIVDLQPLLGLASAPITRSTRLIVVEHGPIQAAVVCSAVADLITTEHDAIDAPTALPGGQAHYLHGVINYEDRPVALLDLGAMFDAIAAHHAG